MNHYYALFSAESLAMARYANVSTAGVLEAVMLVCFGLAWPMANLRMLRTRQATGKGSGFTSLILLGYLSGAASKVMMSSDGSALAPVFWLYVLNAFSVAANLVLQWHYSPRQAGRVLPVARKARSAFLTLLCGLSLWSPMSARPQGDRPLRSAHSVVTKPTQAPAANDDRRFSTAYGRFVRQADRGDANGASAALFMLRNGKTLFGSDWSATEEQQAYWNALAVNAARYQFFPVVNPADD